MLCVCPPHAGEVKLLPSLFQGHSNVNKPNGSKIKWYICGYCTAVFSSLPSLRPLDVECKGHWSRRNTVSTSHNVFCVLFFFFIFHQGSLDSFSPWTQRHKREICSCNTHQPWNWTSMHVNMCRYEGEPWYTVVRRVPDDTSHLFLKW